MSRKTTSNVAPGTDKCVPGRLRLVATPIGNLEDITVRALRTLKESDLIAAEDTRVTSKLLHHFDIHTQIVSHHAHSGQEDVILLVGKMMQGFNVALVSDAGSPCISDPGHQLVVAAIECGIIVEPIPGPCALVASVSASGLSTARFTFEGFLPRSNDRKERLLALATERRTMVIYESPHRLVETLNDLAKYCGPLRPAVVARELTKIYESFIRGTLASCAEHYLSEPPRGECVIIVAGGAGIAAEIPLQADTDTLLRERIVAGKSTKEAAREVAVMTGLARRDLYNRAIQLVNEGLLTEEA